ncbi:MAG: hypothetical protein M1832_003723 [Thelocarpon impressellum]|nr:MAG: hypothetical protein M1832_003723 [Thelocarpon impressellum]
MEVISFLARQLKMNIKSFQFAGTKDRRAVTVQRASVYRLQADRLAGLNRSLRGSKVGNYEYNPTGLELGELAGNEFIITLRDCHFPNVGSDGSALGEESSQAIAIRESLNSLSERGFINYFGLQRFGTFSARTDTVGVKMLQGDFEGACSEILSYSPEALAAAQDPLSSMAQNPVSSDDKARAHALHTFKTTGNAAQALENLPYKFSGEWALLRFLGGKDRQSDFQGALQAVPRNLRTMYVHAYQSLVWNVVAGERWRRFGSHVVAGDLVLVNEHKDEGTEMVVDEVDESGEVVVHPAVDDATAAKDDRFERARALTQEEVGSNKYSIFDVVLPTPGFDVLYPANELAEYYKTFMGSDRGGGLDPHDMRRKWKDISLSGNYRKLLARPFGHTRADFELKRYEVDDEQMVQTDLEKLEKRSRDPKPSGAAVDASRPPPKTAVVLRLQLGTGQYATMALRELMGSTGVKTYKPDYGGGR